MLQERLNIPNLDHTDKNEPQDHKIWLHAMIYRGRTERITTVVTLTPEMAAAMLELNQGNRPIGLHRVKRHVDRLKAGTFILTHQGISFAKDGTLNDGQHRLSAIAECGIGAEMQVTFGASRDEFLVVDKGERRTSADDLAIMKMSNGTIRASLAQRLYAIENSHIGTVDSEIITAYAQDRATREMEEAIVMASRMKRLVQPTAIGLAHYWIATKTNKPKDRQDEFWRGRSTGENITGVMLTLREWLRTDGPEQTGSRQRSVVIAAVIILGWNAYNQRKTKSLQHKSWPHAIKLPEPV